MEPGVATPIIAVLGAIVVSLFNVVFWPAMRSLLGHLWDRILTALGGRKFEIAYLDAVIGQNRFLRMLPTTLVPVTAEGVHQELDNLYIALSVSNRHGGLEATTLGDALANHDRLVILGDPGAGKTTTLKYLALALARARRKRASSRDPKTRMRERTAIGAARLRVQHEFGMPGWPLPVFVYLNRWRDIEKWPQNRSLLDKVREDCQGIDSLRGSPTDFFDKKFKNGECVFLFDAFDELGSAQTRDEAARVIGEFAASAPHGNRFLVTSRIVGYKGQLTGHGFQVSTIQPLSRDLVGELVQKWYTALKEPHLAEELLDALHARPKVYELAVNPMLLSIIVLVQYVRRMIPERRHVLYEECIKILVERRFAPVSVQDAYNRVFPAEDAFRLLQKIAVTLHKRGLREVSRNVLENDIIPALSGDVGPWNWVENTSPQTLVHNIEERSQLLTERGFDERGLPVMAFSHLTFQEYLASLDFRERAVACGVDAITEQLLELYSKNPAWWEEIVLLYAAQLSPAQQSDFLRRFSLGADET